MQILARSDDRYLLVADGVEPGALEPDTPGRILDTETGRLYPWRNVHSILSHNPQFAPYDGSQDALGAMLADAREVEFGEATGRS